MAQDENHKAGYGHPPLDKRFPPGRSGNPSGRKKRLPSMGEILLQKLEARTRIVDGDLELAVTKQEALVQKLVDLALAGNQRATSLVFTLCESAQASDPSRNDGVDDALIEQIIEAEVERRMNVRSAKENESK